MDLSPDDIVSYRFKQTLRGYAIEEVDALLDRLADQVERHLAELEQLRERLSVAEAAAAQTRETEGTLQRTLVVAQQAAERNLAEAEAQAEARLAEASGEAERVRSEAAEEAERVRSEAAEEAEQLRTGAADEAERVRTEAVEEADRVRTEAYASATETIDEAQRLARREAEAARGRVEEAVRRHAEVIESVVAHRDALRANLAVLEELSLNTPPAPPVDLVVGELYPGSDDDGPEVWQHEFSTDGQVADGSEGDVAPGHGDLSDDGDIVDLDEHVDEHVEGFEPGETHRPLQVRIHDDRATAWRDDASVGSEGHDEG